jgi:hypothetical protein
MKARLGPSPASKDQYMLGVLASPAQKRPAPPKVRPDVEIEMLLRAAREQEQAGHIDQALALTARMETALQEWRTKLQPPTREANEAPQTYIKRLADLPDYFPMPIATPAPKPDQSKDTPAGNQRETLDRQGAASQQDPRANAFRDVYTLSQPYKLQDNAKPGQKDATSWALGVTVPIPVFDRTNGAKRQMLSLADVERAAVPFPETVTTDHPAANNPAGGAQEQRRVRRPMSTRAQVAAGLERKVSLHISQPTGLIETIKILQSAYSGPDGPVPIFFDLGGLRKANANLDHRIALDVKDAPLGTALKMVLDQVGLAYQVEDGRVVIGAPGADHAAPAKK